MPVEEDLFDLLHGHEETATATLNRAREALSGSVAAFQGWYDHSAIGALSERLGGILRSFESVAARNADNFQARAITASTGKLYLPVGVRRTSLGRQGVDNAGLIGRISNVYRWQQAQFDKGFIESAQSGKLLTPGKLQTPIDAALERLDKIVNTNLQMAQRNQAITTMAGSDRVIGMRRVIHPEMSDEGTCGLCIAASDRRYHKGELLPIHPGCHCEPMPITQRFDPAALNEIDFKQIYADAAQYGKASSAEALRQTRYKIDQHGEIGPVLRPDDQPIRGVAEVAKAESNADRKARQRAEMRKRWAAREAQREQDDSPKAALTPEPAPRPQSLLEKLAALVTRRGEMVKAWQKLYNGGISPYWGDDDKSDRWMSQLQQGQDRIDQLDSEIAEMDDDPLPELPHILIEHDDPADEIAWTNPDFRSDIQYQINCTHAVTAFEMRRRGYRVKASPLPNLLSGRETQDVVDAWRTPEGGTRKLTQTRWSNAENMLSQYPDGARGWASVQWKTGTGHVFAWEKRDGKIMWLDPQRDLVLNGDELEKYQDRSTGTVKLVRMDDLVPTDEVIRYVDPSSDRLENSLADMDRQTAVANERQELVTRTGQLGPPPMPQAQPLFMPALDKLPDKLVAKIDKKLETETHLTEPQLAERVQANLIKLYQEGNPADRDWYRNEGAALQQISDDLTEKYGHKITREQFTGMVSVTSALKRWPENKAFAEGIAKMLGADKPFKVSQPEIDRYNAWAKARPGDIAEQFTAGPGTYRLSDVPAGFAASRPDMPHAINTNSVISAIKIWRGDLSVDDAVGGPKQRSFVNNLMDPDNPAYVTVDTWHYRAMLGDIPITHTVKGKEYTYTIKQWADMDLAVEDGRALEYGYDPAKDRYDPANKKAAEKATREPQNFFQAGPASKADGYESNFGTYPWWVQQTQAVAFRLGVIPADLQAIAWVKAGGGL